MVVRYDVVATCSPCVVAPVGPVAGADVPLPAGVNILPPGFLLLGLEVVDAAGRLAVVSPSVGPTLSGSARSPGAKIAVKLAGAISESVEVSPVVDDASGASVVRAVECTDEPGDV